MAKRHIARYRAMVTGNTIEKEMGVLEARKEGNLKKLFGVKNEFRRENRLGGNLNEQPKRF